MVRIIIALLFCFPAVAFAQTYQQLSERAIECIEKDSLPKAEELLLQALKLEPKNAKNALLFSNLGLVQRRLGEFDKALESYSFALNFAPLAVPILLDRAAIYMEMGKTDRAYTDYCQVLDEDKQNKEALLMRAYIYVLRRDYPAARMDYNRLLELDLQSYSGRLGLATLEQKEGKFREALEILNKMITATPDDATLYIARADVEREMKHEDLALVDLEEAIRLDAASADAYLLRGNIYLAQKKKGLAKADFEKAILNGLFNVLIRHGNYISVYCNLSSASVKAGDTVKTKQSIGQVFSDGTDNGRTVLHFQLRREKEKLNPEPWLNR